LWPATSLYQSPRGSRFSTCLSRCRSARGASCTAVSPSIPRLTGRRSNFVRFSRTCIPTGS
jgi:hypothetical protein